MIDVGLAASEQLWAELCNCLTREEESAAVILAGRSEEDGRLTLCMNRVLWVPEEAYDDRSLTHMTIRSSGWMPALAEAETGGWQPIFFHSHPGASPDPSCFDDHVADQLAPVFASRAEAAYVSLIVGGTPDDPTFSGSYRARDVNVDVRRLRVVGERMRVLSAHTEKSRDSPDLRIFDRQIRAFGRQGQLILRGLRVGIAGAGGTGSAVCEQLVRLGVGSIVVVDDDHVTATNVTRIYGSTCDDVGKPKAEVLADHAKRTGLGSAVTFTVAKVTERRGFEALKGCDAVFGCTDDNAGRATLSRLAYWYCVSVFDVGVVITTADGEITGLFERLSVMGPGRPCLFCRDRIDVGQMQQEALSEDERRQLADEGYARGLDDPDPSVIPYTTMVASMATDEFLQRLFGFGLDDPPNEILVRVPDREIRRLGGSSREGHFCADLAVIGRADREPPLNTMWA